MSTDLEARLVELLEERVGPAPVRDAGAALARGRELRRRRHLRRVAVVGAVVVLAGAGVRTGLEAVEGRALQDPVVLDHGLDLDGGLRAYGDPGVFLSLGGLRVPDEDLGRLDVEGAGSALGVVYYDHGRPWLLGRDGGSRPLTTGDADPLPDTPAPGARTDRDGVTVAYATVSDGTATVEVRDLSSWEVLGRREVPCPEGDCAGLVVDAVDDGRVFLRVPGGAGVWDVASGAWTAFDPATRVADVRAGVVLHDGPASPALEDLGLRQVAGPIDGQLTFDGAHVVSWSSRLEPTTPGGEPVVLDRGPVTTEDGLGFWTVDTDGSVLVAWTREYPRFTVEDCDAVSGACERLGTMRVRGGDPQFLGNDM
jgi:hypothetical protein